MLGIERDFELHCEVNSDNVVIWRILSVGVWQVLVTSTSNRAQCRFWCLEDHHMPSHSSHNPLTS